MGLLKKLFGKNPPAPNANDRVDGIAPPWIDIEVEVNANRPSADNDSWQKRIEEDARLAAEGRSMRRMALMGQGVDVEQFTNEKTFDDALIALDTFVPMWNELSVPIDQAIVNGDYQNLTKTGKVPKNVYVGRVAMHDEASFVDPADFVSVSIKYMASGAINMVDVSLAHNAKTLSFALRNKAGSWEITTIDTYDIRRNFQQRIYSGDDRNATELLIAQWDEIWK